MGRNLVTIDVSENLNFVFLDGVLYNFGMDRVNFYNNAKSGSYQMPDTVSTIDECHLSIVMN